MRLALCTAFGALGWSVSLIQTGHGACAQGQSDMGTAWHQSETHWPAPTAPQVRSGPCVLSLTSGYNGNILQKSASLKKTATKHSPSPTNACECD